MGDTQIAWAEKGWSPVLGCSKTSPGCKNCYAVRSVWRLAHNSNLAIAADHAGLVTASPGAEVDGPFIYEWTNKVSCLEHRVGQPSAWKKPARIFVCPMADLFHPMVPTKFLIQVWITILNNPHHRFLILTKRPQLLANFTEILLTKYASFPHALTINGVSHYPDVWPKNVWLGVSVENQKYAEARVPVLMSIPCYHRWVSAEPLLGRLDLSDWLYPGGIEWVVAGSESGPNARKDDISWYWDLMEQCEPSAGPRTPLFIKQITALFPKKGVVHMPEVPSRFYDADGVVPPDQITRRVWAEYPPDLLSTKVPVALGGQ